MVMQLMVIAGPDKGLAIPLNEEGPARVGRSQSILTRLTDPHVSRVHCEVLISVGQAVVTDSSSAGGTFVNGKRVARQSLRPGDIIQVGSTQLRYDNTDFATETSTLGPGASPGAKPAEQAAASLETLVGQTLSHFEIAAIVAKGRLGVIFKARDTNDGRTVALKVLNPEFSTDEDDMQRFVRAMKTVLPLRHPNLVATLGAGRTGEYCWASMEFIEGESMAQLIQRIGVAGMVDWRLALRGVIHLARGLDYAHKNNVIHRNITPANVLIQASDKVAKLGDLMLAKALEGSMARQITRPGELLGEIDYLSPERTHGTTDVDGRSDIYSLGAMVYRLLTGRPPFAGGSLMETIIKIRQSESKPEKPKKYQLAIPDLFEGIVLRMLAKQPADRYQTAAELLAELERVAKFQGVTV
jgi:serine/threonine protein kinase